MGKSERRFKREREEHYRVEREKEAERKKARLKGFKPATLADMTATVLGTQVEPEPNTGPRIVDANGVPLNRKDRRRMGLRVKFQ